MFSKVIYVGTLFIQSSFIKASLVNILAITMMASIAQGSSFNPQTNWNSKWLIAGTGLISLEEAVRKAKRKHKGKVLSAKKSEIKGSLVYKIKMIIPDSRVKTVWIDGQTGEIIRRDH